MAHKRQDIVPQKLRGYLMWASQFCWHCLFDQFSLLRAVFLSVCIPLFHIVGLSPGGASTRAVALISTCLDMTGISSKGCFPLSLFYFLFLPSPTSFLLPGVPTVFIERSGYFLSSPSSFSLCVSLCLPLSPLLLLCSSHSVSLFLSTKGF